MARQSGGPAFPRPSSEHTPGQDGMELRDWLAGQALAGILACSPADHGGYGDTAGLAESCYAYADALLAARQQ